MTPEIQKINLQIAKQQNSFFPSQNAAAASMLQRPASQNSRQTRQRGVSLIDAQNKLKPLQITKDNLLPVETTANDKKNLQKNKESDVIKNRKFSDDLMQGEFSPIKIPLLDIPGIRPLVYTEAEELLTQLNEKDEFYNNDDEEEFLMFTVEITDRKLRRQDGPHHTLRWRRNVRDNYKFIKDDKTEATEDEINGPPQRIEEAIDEIEQQETSRHESRETAQRVVKDDVLGEDKQNDQHLSEEEILVETKSATQEPTVKTTDQTQNDDQNDKVIDEAQVDGLIPQKEAEKEEVGQQLKITKHPAPVEVFVQEKTDITEKKEELYQQATQYIEERGDSKASSCRKQQIIQAKEADVKDAAVPQHIDQFAIESALFTTVEQSTHEALEQNVISYEEAQNYVNNLIKEIDQDLYQQTVLRQSEKETDQIASEEIIQESIQVSFVAKDLDTSNIDEKEQIISITLKDAVYELIEDPILIDKVRAQFENLDQNFVKEIETMWMETPQKVLDQSMTPASLIAQTSAESMQQNQQKDEPTIKLTETAIKQVSVSQTYKEHTHQHSKNDSIIEDEVPGMEVDSQENIVDEADEENETQHKMSKIVADFEVEESRSMQQIDLHDSISIEEVDEIKSQSNIRKQDNAVGKKNKLNIMEDFQKALQDNNNKEQSSVENGSEGDDYTSQFQTTVAGGASNEIPKVTIPPKIQRPSQKKLINDRRRTVAALIKASKSGSQASIMEQEFAEMRESSNQKASIVRRDSSAAYVKRQPQPKLIEKANFVKMKQENKSILQTPQAKPKNPPVPRFAHPVITVDKSAVAEQALNEMPKKKPRPPPVPENLRASSQKPSIHEINQSRTENAQPKKPRVPKVSELMPGVKIKKPSEVPADIDSKKSSSQSPQRTIKLKNKLMMQTPSVGNIHKPSSISDEEIIKTPQKGEARTTGITQFITTISQGVQVNTITLRGSRERRRHQNQSAISATAFKNTVKTYNQKNRRKNMLSNTKHFKSTLDIEEKGNFSTLQIEQDRGSAGRQRSNNSKSPSLSPGARSKNNEGRLVLIPDSDQPYEQSLQQQLYDTYRSKGKSQKKSFLQDRNSANITGTNFHQLQPGTQSWGTSALTIDDQAMTIVPTPLNKLKLPNDASEPDFARNQQSQSPSGTGIVLASSKDFNEKLQLEDPQGVKSFQTLSPKSYMRLVRQQNRSVRVEDTQSGLKSQTLDPYSDKIDHGGPLAASKSIGGQDTTDQPNLISRQTFQPYCSIPKLLQVNPTWNDPVEQTVPADMVGKQNINDILKRNSNAFLMKEQTHIKGFVQAQSNQKKNLDWIAGSSSINLATPFKKHHQSKLRKSFDKSKQFGTRQFVTEQKTTTKTALGGAFGKHLLHQQSTPLKTASDSVIPDLRKSLSSMPAINLGINSAFYNTQKDQQQNPVVDAYGNIVETQDLRERHSRSNASRHQMIIPLLNQTHKNDANKNATPLQYDKNRQYLKGAILRDHLFNSSKLSHKSISTANYENSAVKNRSNNRKNNDISDLLTKGDEPAAWLSGRAIGGGDVIGLADRQQQQQYQVSSNRSNSNFFPGFDSRGNVGIASDPNEFAPRKKNSNFGGGSSTSIGDRELQTTQHQKLVQLSYRDTTPSQEPNRINTQHPKSSSRLPSLRSTTQRSENKPAVSIQNSYRLLPDDAGD